jgi:PTS system mannitol-specific IIC component
LKFFGKDIGEDSDKLEAAKLQSEANKNKPAEQGRQAAVAEQTSAATADADADDFSDLEVVVFACDAGMGSSAMGASQLKKKLKAAGVEGVDVVHYSVDQMPTETRLVVVHTQLAERVRGRAPKARVFEITNFLSAPEFDQVVELLKKSSERR